MTARPPPGHEPTQLMPRRDVGAELRPGHPLQEFVIEGLIGIGGYSIVYRARDTRLDRLVALKEYIPATLALRYPDGSVQARTPRHVEHFHLGLRSFINEARLLASFDHPALVKVYRFWSENGTAYMVMPLYEGVTLKKWLADLGAPPSEAWLRELARQLTEALGVLHAARCFHRDVAPDNILLQFDPRAGTSFLEQPPRPLLLDFGAARRVVGDATQQLTAILKSGYSPVEQYEGAETKRQGAWTDVYALAAVLYTAVTGRAPASSIARIVKDPMPSAARAAAGRCSAPFLAAIDAGLAVRPEDRPQSMAAFRAALDASVPVTPPAAPRAAPARPAPAASPTPPAAAPHHLAALVAGAVAGASLVAALLWWALR